MGFDTIVFEKRDRIATITLNRPERLNAINEDMANELVAAMGDVSEDEEIKVLIVKGAGRGFCAGGDFDFDRLRKGDL